MTRSGEGQRWKKSKIKLKIPNSAFHSPRGSPSPLTQLPVAHLFIFPKVTLFPFLFSFSVFFSLCFPESYLFHRLPLQRQQWNQTGCVFLFSVLFFPPSLFSLFPHHNTKKKHSIQKSRRLCLGLQNPLLITFFLWNLNSRVHSQTGTATFGWSWQEVCDDRLLDFVLRIHTYIFFSYQVKRRLTW